MINNLQIHKPVLLNEVIKLISVKPNGTYVDCTAGFGGHSQAIASKLSKQGRLICIDQDQDAVDYLKKLFSNDQRIEVVHDNFVNVKSVFKQCNIQKADGVIVDLGVSSLMFDEPTRGFSYHNDGPLDMRMNQKLSTTAADVINKYSQKQLIEIFKKYGEIKDCYSVVNKIISSRLIAPITTTKQLVDIIKASVNPKLLHTIKHPARQYFQAIRIYVNDELNILHSFLEVVSQLIALNGTLAIISFHSLEDKIIKDRFNFLTTSHLPKEVPLVETPPFQLITKKPITPTKKEMTINRRSRSAKLRAIKRTYNQEQYV